MAKNDVQDFIELRLGFQGMADFSAAALRFLDKQGIALKARPPVSSNGHGAESLREQVKRHYKKRRQHYPTPGGYSARVLAKREISRKLLDALDPDEPRRVNHMEGSRAMGSLVRRGYARKMGDGYVRTSKPYILNKVKGGSNEEPTTSPSDKLTVPQVAKRLKVSETHVRTLIAKKKIAGRRETLEHKGRTRTLYMIDADSVAQYAADSK